MNDTKQDQKLVDGRGRPLLHSGVSSAVREVASKMKRRHGTVREFVNELKSEAVKAGFGEKNINIELKAMGFDLESDQRVSKLEFEDILHDNELTIDVTVRYPDGRVERR